MNEGLAEEGRGGTAIELTRGELAEEQVKVAPELLAEVKIEAVVIGGSARVEELVEIEAARPGERGRMKPGLEIRLEGVAGG